MEKQDAASLLHQATNNQPDHADFELKMLWRLRWFLAYLYATALILSIAAAPIIAIATRNIIPSIIPTAIVLAMKPINKFAFDKLQKRYH